MHETTVDSKYRIDRLMGQGGMGAVYEARHLGTGRRVALKVIVPSALMEGGDMLARFQREARASGAIDSQHVVQVLDTGIDPETASPYLVMEYLTGEDLQSALHRCGALPTNAALRIIGQACVGLAAAHAGGIIHRDIKAANLFIARREGGDLTIKILDFGIAKVRADPLSSSPNEALTRTGSLLGSPLYMSPEQALGAKDIDARSDVFSLGVTLYEALCGVTPNNECETFGKLVVAIAGGKGLSLHERAPQLPREVTAIVDKALALDPKDRFQTAGEMLASIAAQLPQGTALDPSMIPGPPRGLSADLPPALAQHTALLPLPPPSPEPFPETNSTAQRRRTRWLFALSAAPLIVLCGLGIGIYELRRSTASSHESGTPAAPVEGSIATQTHSASSAEVTLASAPTVLDASVTTDPPAPPSAAVAPLVVRPRSVALSSRTTVAPAAPATGPAASASRTHCDPPYTFNADGKKIWKRDCL